MYNQTVFANIAPVTPSDTVPFANGATGILYIGGTGNVVVVLANDQIVRIDGVQAGTILPVRVKQVRATNTTATNIAVMF